MGELLPGTEVRARGLRWELVLSERLGPQTLYRLRGLEGAVKGREIDLLHPFESVEPVIHELQPKKAGPLQNWLVYHQAFLLEQALGPDAFLASHPGRLRLEPYQLVPVLRAIRMSRPRILLADGVGLGKTIQAGLVLTELIARRIAHRILIVSPAGPLLDQWKTEMRERFGLRLEVIDRSKLDEIRKSTELGANPFDHIAFGLSSMDFLKQEAILDQLERATYDVIVIDEAHHCMDLGASGEREDSLRRRMAEVLARRCDSLILATATPHDGNDRSFSSLCELLDYSLVDGNGNLRGNRHQAHVVRRLKVHIKDPATGECKFKDRIVIPVPVIAAGERFSTFRNLQRALVELIGPELRRALRNRRYEDVLSFIALLKRSVSSVAACRTTLQTVFNRFAQIVAHREESQDSKRQRLRTLRDYNRKLERFGALSASEEMERELLEAEDLAQSLAALHRELRSGERRLKQAEDLRQGLEDLLRIAERAAADDPKFSQIHDEIAAIRQKEPHANILVYTEYTTTQQALANYLRDKAGGEVLTLCGDDDEKDRGKITERFRTIGRLILVSTDAAAEGLNLHQRCHHLLHVELPFNPNRLEQRNGRIDRYGQNLNPVVRYLYLTRSFEERILLRLIAKYERQRSRLTFVPNTLGNLTSSEANTARLLQGLADEENWLIKRDQSPCFSIERAAENDDTDDATHELLEEIDRSLSGFEKATRTRTWLGEVGMNAEQTMVTQADSARLRGQQEGAVDLVQFVTNAVLLDGGSIHGRLTDSYFSLELPPAWSYTMGDLPGYDASTSRLTLTTDIDVTGTKDEKTVGYLGRAHPLVRLALDRVRHLSYGGEAGRVLDIRASAVELDLPAPGLLLTYLGRVNSQAGREYERVVAVHAQASGQVQFIAESAKWLELIRNGKAISTRDIWERTFGDHWAAVIEEARLVAIRNFEPLAESFIRGRCSDLEKERAELENWLSRRAEDICGGQITTATQQELFSTDKKVDVSPVWQSIRNGRERLAAFVADSTRPPSRRSEAEGVLRLFEQRSTALKAGLALSSPEVLLLGLLMLVPRKTGKEARRA